MSNYVKNAKRAIEEVTKTRVNWSGLCLWIEEISKTSDLSPILIGLGCRWSQKRQQWYLRIEEAISANI